MPKIKTVARTETFTKLNSVSKSEFNEHRDCAVKAVALACDVSYDVAHSTLKRLGRKDKVGTPVHIITQAVVELGFNIRRWSFIERQNTIQSYPGVHAKLQNITTHHPRRFRRVWEKHDHKTLMFLTPRHIATFKGGVVHDWSINNSLQVTEVYEVTKA